MKCSYVQISNKLYHEQRKKAYIVLSYFCLFSAIWRAIFALHDAIRETTKKKEQWKIPDAIKLSVWCWQSHASVVSYKLLFSKYGVQYAFIRNILPVIANTTNYISIIVWRFKLSIEIALLNMACLAAI